MSILTAGEFRARVEGLIESRRLILCCSCCERVLPLFERLQNSDAVRELLDLEWTAAAGNQINENRWDELERIVQAVIPKPNDESDLKTDVAMSSGVSVLETLDVIKGNRQAVLRVAFSTIEVLELLQLLVGQPVHPDFDTLEVINNAKIIPAPLLKEWRSLCMLIETLSGRDQSIDLKSFRKQQAARGFELLSTYVNAL